MRIFAGLTVFLLAASAFIFSLTDSAHAASSVNYTVPTFEADYYLSRDSRQHAHLRVHERINVKFANEHDRSLIRNLPRVYGYHRTHLRVQDVTDTEGRSLKYTATKLPGAYSLYIDATPASATTDQTYLIDYTMSNIVSTPRGYNLSTLPINGYDWRTQLGQVTARIHLASDLAARLRPDGITCSTGAKGQSDQACTVSPGQSDAPDNITTITATRPLEAGETLSYAAKFGSHTFSSDIDQATEAQQALYKTLMIGIPILIALYVFFRVIRVNRLEYNFEIVIDSPVQWVADTFSNPENYKHWQPGFVWYEPISGKAGQSKSRDKLIYHLNNRRIEVTRTILAANSPVEFIYLQEAKGIRNTVKNYFIAIDDGHTKWVVEEEYMFYGVMRFVAAVMPGAFRRDTKATLEHLKAYVEKGTSFALHS